MVDMISKEELARIRHAAEDGKSLDPETVFRVLDMVDSLKIRLMWRGVIEQSAKESGKICLN